MHLMFPVTDGNVPIDRGYPRPRRLRLGVQVVLYCRHVCVPAKQSEVTRRYKYESAEAVGAETACPSTNEGLRMPIHRVVLVNEARCLFWERFRAVNTCRNRRKGNLSCSPQTAPIPVDSRSEMPAGMSPGSSYIISEA